MPFGGFCPLPLRLGGDAETGWTAAQHARFIADMIAVERTSSFATVTYTKSGSTVTVSDYSGKNGSGPLFAPTVTVNGTGDVTFTWPGVYEDQYEVVHRPDFFAADAGSATGGATVELGVSSVRVRSFSEGGAAEDSTVTVEVYGESGVDRLAIGDFDGEPEKTDSETEPVPYAWTWYQDYTAMLGDGLSRATTGLVHAKKIALARFECAKTRAVERALCNSNPATADELLGNWVQVFKIPVSDDMPRWEIRRRCSARLRAFGGCGFTEIDAAVRELLRDGYVQSFRQRGADLDSPPSPTYWSENPGSGPDLGGGTWMSSRAHLVVHVAQTPDQNLAQFLRIANVDLFDLLDRRLPAWMTFNWTAWSGGYDPPGFRLDISHLDFEGLGA